jgi:hypothetical protein
MCAKPRADPPLRAIPIFGRRGDAGESANDAAAKHTPVAATTVRSDIKNILHDVLIIVSPVHDDLADPYSRTGCSHMDFCVGA